MPQFLINESSVLEEFRGIVRSKLEELSQNYIKIRTKDAIVWSSSDSVECAGSLHAPRSPLSSLTISRAKEMVVFDLKGCSGKTIMREIFEAKDVSDFTMSKYLAGEIPKIEVKRYVLQDGQRLNLFELDVKNGLSTFGFLTKRFLDIYKEPKRWQYKTVGYEASYSNENYNFGVMMDFDDSRLSVEWDDANVRILDSDFRRISINTFLISYSHAVQSTTLSFLAGIVKYLLDGLPSTEFVSSGGQNSRFLDEMRLTYTRLLNNLELNLVKQFIQDAIKAIESGLLKITDNRPEEK